MRRRQDKVAPARRDEKAGNLDDAERLYREAIAEGDTFGYNNLAQLLIEQGRLREVERLFRKGVIFGDPLAARNRALFLLEEGRNVQLKAAIDQAKRMGRSLGPEELESARDYFARGGEPERTTRSQ
jgi:tetratricopeptide (TPR) repeat protein